MDWRILAAVLLGNAAIAYITREVDRKERDKREAEMQSQLLARINAKDIMLAEKDKQMLDRLDAKDARFEAFVERVLAATRPTI